MFCISIIIFLLITPIRAIKPIYNLNALHISSFIGFILYFGFTHYTCKRYNADIKPLYTFLAILTGFLIMQIPVRIFNFEDTLITLPEAIIHITGIILGYIGYTKKIRIWKTIIIALFFLSIWVLKYSEMYSNYIDYGTISQRVSPKIVSNFLMSNKQGDTISLYSLKGKYIIFDCWHNSCRSCFENFPNLQSAYDELQPGNNSIEIFALNFVYDDKNPFDIIEKQGFSFPVLKLINNRKEVVKELDIRVFPTILVFNDKSELIFRGKDIQKAISLVYTKINT